MKSIKNAAKKILNVLFPFLSRHPLLKKVSLAFMSLFPGLKARILRYKRKQEVFGDKQAFLEYGFGNMEIDGVWMVKEDGKITFDYPDDDFPNIDIYIEGHIYHEDYKVSVSIGGKEAAIWRAGVPLVLSVPKWVCQAGKHIELCFHIPDLKSPMELGISEDERKLGLFIRNMKVNGLGYEIVLGPILTEKGQYFYSYLSKAVSRKAGNICA